MILPLTRRCLSNNMNKGQNFFLAVGVSLLHVLGSGGLLCSLHCIVLLHIHHQSTTCIVRLVFFSFVVFVLFLIMQVISVTFLHRFWLDLTPTQLMWNLSDTGWAKSAYSNLFGPWHQGACVFIHHTERFDPHRTAEVWSKNFV